MDPVSTPSTHVQPVGGIDPAEALQRHRSQQDKLTIQRGDDSIELSSMARALSRDDQATPVRHQLVEQVKQRIAKGEYDSPEVIHEALNRLLSDLWR
ncbi:MAG: flagellar biosynthesis anti-sigma factor FlgM [Phycisphaeraceae bacterium]|nr:flagellar biosynthesis anti-sigma factor FlgM [Phycisphaeraceae bacterium]